MQQILVTGGAGKLGRLVVKQLSAAGYSVRGMSRRASPGEDWPGAEWKQADLVTGEGLAEAVQGMDVVVHLAGKGNWKVDFDQATIPTIAPGDQATVTATITPTGDAVTGDYQVTLTATAPGENGTNAATDDLAMTFTVETSPIWLLAGFGLIVVIIVALFYVFRTYGRR